MALISKGKKINILNTRGEKKMSLKLSIKSQLDTAPSISKVPNTKKITPNKKKPQQ